MASPRRGSDRLLAGIVIAIASLIVVGIAAVLLVGQRPATEFPEDSPQGIVQRYLKALEDGQSDAAYAYLSESVKDDSLKRTYQRSDPVRMERTRRILLEAADVADDTARITVSVSTIVSDSPTSTSESTMRLEFRLRREASGWRIVSPVYPPYLGLVPPFPPQRALEIGKRS